MKNKIIFSLVFMLVIVGFSSCDKDTTAGFTRITYYPTLKVLGEPIVVINKGTSYIDAGCYAELNGADVTKDVQINSTVNTQAGGVYSISYKITNTDGFFVTGSRLVYVVDTTPSVITSGTYTVATGTYRLNQTSTAKTKYSGYSISIFQTSPGIFYVTDFMGGYYDQRAAYGSNYAMTGYFKLNADNTLSLQSSHVIGWGDGLNSLTNASVDPTTGTITWSALYVGYLQFNVILNK